MPDEQKAKEALRAAAAVERRKVEELGNAIGQRAAPLFDLIPPGHTAVVQRPSSRIVVPGRPPGVELLFLYRPVALLDVRLTPMATVEGPPKSPKRE